MKRFRDFKLGVKQGIIFAVILVLMGGVEFFLMYRMTVLKAEIDTITSKWLPSAVASASIKSSASDLRNMQLQQAIARNDSTKRRLAGVMVDLIDEIETHQDEYEKLIGGPEQLAIYHRFEDRWERYQELSFTFFGMVEENRGVEAVDLLTGEAQLAFDAFSAVLDTLVSVNETASSDAALHAARMYDRARRLGHIVLIFAVLLALVLATVFVRLVTRPVTQLAGAARTVAAGNINIELDVLADDEIGDLSRSFNQMTASLRKARDEIMSQQRKLQEANAELETKNRDLEAAMKLLQETQQQLVMREKMASLGNLVAGVAHEINNPLGAVVSATDTSSRSIEVLRKALDERLGPDALDGTGRLQKALHALQANTDVTLTATSRISEIVKSLKNFARLDEAEFQDADLHEGLDSTLTLLDHSFKNRITVEKYYGDLPRIPCYPNQLNQVFMNLLSNAEHAIGDKGVITIKTRRDGDHVVVEVTDTGRGIVPEDLPRIFDPGFTTKGVGVGTGLGLSITYNIIERHGGTIRADSKPGRGTTMTVTLPIHQPDAPPSQ